MNLVTIDTSPGNMSMYIAPNNTSYLQIGANASTIIIGTTSQTAITQLGNTRITNSGNSGALYLSTNSKINNTGGYIADYLLTTEDTWDSSIAQGTPIYGRTVIINGGNTVFNAANGYRNTTAYAGDIVIRSGSSNSPSNDGTQSHTLRGGNIYIDGGSAWCKGGGVGGTLVDAVPGSIFIRTARPSSENTYYSDQFIHKMTITPTSISTTVPMTISEETGTGDTMSPTAGSLIIKHNNFGGGSSIVFPSKSNSTDFGYIRYRDDVNNAGVGNEQGRLEIGVENDFGAPNTNIDCLVLNKNGGNVGIGLSNPQCILDVNGTTNIRNVLTIGGFTPPTIYCNFGISTISATLRDGIAIKASGGNVMDFMQFINAAGTVIGKITNTGGTGTGVDFASASDRRLKKDIIQMENILDKIMLLKPCNYKWISNDTPSFGFIAQEVFEVFPKLYNEIPNSDGNIDEPSDKNTGDPLHYGLDYGRFTPYIVKALQEQNTIINLQKDEIKSLESKVDVLQKQIADILQRLN